MSKEWGEKLLTGRKRQGRRLSLCHVASFLSLLTGATGHEQKAKQWHFHVHRPGRSYITHHSLHQAGGSAKPPPATGQPLCRRGLLGSPCKVPPRQQGPVPGVCHQVRHRAGTRPGLKLVAPLDFHFDGGDGGRLTTLLGKYLSCGRKRRR